LLITKRLESNENENFKNLSNKKTESNESDQDQDSEEKIASSGEYDNFYKHHSSKTSNYKIESKYILYFVLIKIK
jgi:hypothetical protein